MISNCLRCAEIGVNYPSLVLLGILAPVILYYTWNSVKTAESIRKARKAKNRYFFRLRKARRIYISENRSTNRATSRHRSHTSINRESKKDS